MYTDRAISDYACRYNGYMLNNLQFPLNDQNGNTTNTYVEIKIIVHKKHNISGNGNLIEA
jgi:hypothetical protein